jgi:hypothetical protein
LPARLAFRAVRPALLQELVDRRAVCVLAKRRATLNLILR